MPAQAAHPAGILAQHEDMKVTAAEEPGAQRRSDYRRSALFYRREKRAPPCEERPRPPVGWGFGLVAAEPDGEVEDRAGCGRGPPPSAGTPPLQTRWPANIQNELEESNKAQK